MIARLARRAFAFRGRAARGAFGAARCFRSSRSSCLDRRFEAWSRPQGLLAAATRPSCWPRRSLATRRMHDRGRSAAWLLAAAVPVLGPLWLLVELGLRKGTPGENPYGADPLQDRRLPDCAHRGGARGPGGRPHRQRRHPASTRCAVLGDRRADHASRRCRRRCAAATGPVSIGGGHFSMGGQTASPGSLHLDMRTHEPASSEFSPQRQTIRVQAGVRWCDIQRFVDPHGLAVKIMQTYANFTVGGSLSVNVPRPLRRPGTADPLGARHQARAARAASVVEASRDRALRALLRRDRRLRRRSA